MELNTPGFADNLVISFIIFLPFFIVITIIVILIKTIRSKSTETNVKRLASASLTTLLSISIVFATLSLPKTIDTTHSIDPLNNITCGWPLPFIQFDNHMSPPPVLTLSCIGWSGSPMDTKKEILWIPFLINLAMTFGILWTGKYLIQKLYNHNKRKHLHEKNLKHIPDN